MPNRIVVGGALISGGALLVAQRDRPPELAGLWELPGGKVADGESDEAALARELHEELGAEVTVGDRLGADVALNPTTVLRAYLVTQTGGTLHPNDHRALKWITVDDLDDLAWVPADRTWLDDLRRVMTPDVVLSRLRESTVEALLAVAVADADPDEVMPPIDAPPGWSPPRVAAFRRFYRSHLAGLSGTRHTQMYLISLRDNVVGMIRMARGTEADTMETGMWLARSARGDGTGAAALRLLLSEVARAGGRRVVAETTADNHAAIGVLRRCGATISHDSAAVRATIAVEPERP